MRNGVPLLQGQNGEGLSYSGVPKSPSPISFLSSTACLLSAPSYFPTLTFPPSSLTLGEAAGLRSSKVSSKRRRLSWGHTLKRKK